MVEEELTRVDDITIKSTVSIGMAMLPENVSTVRDLIVEADNALYIAKRGGKNRVIRSERIAGS
jgi:diguanylate cyclase (GGDEF)-like protein